MTVLLFVVGTLAVTTGDLFQSDEVVEPPASSALKVVPLTSDPGFDSYPAFSADGTRVAFSRRASESEHFHLFVKQPHQSREIQLTEGAYDHVYPTWSPDGSQIAFIRGEHNTREICVMPSMGGPVRTISSLEGRVRGLDWSPDGNSLVLAYAPLEWTFSLQIIDLATGGIQQLVAPLESGWGDTRPRYSPEGDRVAFIRATDSGGDVISLYNTEDGTVDYLDNDLQQIRGIDWYPDGRHLVSSAGDKTRYGLWRLSIESGKKTPVVLPLDRVSSFSVCRSSGAMVVQVPQSDYDLMKYSLTSGSGPDHELPGEVVFKSTQPEYLPTVDPVGSRIAFCSNRTGVQQVFMASDTNEKAEAVTSFEGIGFSTLQWSPDGSKLLFSGADERDSTFVGLLDPGNGQWRKIPLDSGVVFDSFWSADGQWVYYNCINSDNYSSRKARLDGSDGKTLSCSRTLDFVYCDPNDGSPYFIEDLRSGLFRQNPDGVAEQVADFPTSLRIRSFGSHDGRIFFVYFKDKRSTLIAHDLATAEYDTLGVLSKPCAGPLTFFPDGSSLLVASVITSSIDLVLVPELP